MDAPHPAGEGMLRDVAAPMLLDDVAQTSWAQEWEFSRAQTHETNNTKSVYLVVPSTALVAFGAAYVFYLFSSQLTTLSFNPI